LLLYVVKNLHVKLHVYLSGRNNFVNHFTVMYCTTDTYIIYIKTDVVMAANNFVGRLASVLKPHFRKICVKNSEFTDKRI